MHEKPIVGRPNQVFSSRYLSAVPSGMGFYSLNVDQAPRLPIGSTWPFQWLHVPCCFVPLHVGSTHSVSSQMEFVLMVFAKTHCSRAELLRPPVYLGNTAKIGQLSRDAYSQSTGAC